VSSGAVGAPANEESRVAASRKLGLQKSKLRRRILQLEERLGVRLLNRSSRRFSMTKIGREFYDRCIAMPVEAARS
jgi:DNA-binding transcriptional LysR family regulator